MPNPSFICIGAQKAGTTWLSAQLAFHSDIWLPPTKEIHYFERRKPVLPGFIVRFDSDPVMMKVWVRSWQKQSILDMIQLKPRGLWSFWFLHMIRSDAWYKSLFRPAKGKLAGDITPDYSSMDERKIAHLHSLLPDVKIIYLLRDPIERQWSQVAMYVTAMKRYGHDPDEVDILNYLKQERCLQQSLYMENLTRWYKYFPSTQIFIGYVEQIRTEPKNLLIQIFEFLDLRSDSYDFNNDILNKIINAREYPSIPDAVLKFLVQEITPDLQNLHRKLGHPCVKAWLENAKAHAFD